MNNNTKTTIQSKGRLLSLENPIVMGILNVTPDSFYEDSRVTTDTKILQRAEKMLNEGAAILDIGGMSTRPGAVEISIQEELDRVLPTIELIKKNFPTCWISIDTYRASVARSCILAGADMINDISAGNMDDRMLETVGKLNVPYIMMHMQGQPHDMQRDPNYEDVVGEIFRFFIEKKRKIEAIGLKDVIIDPGFGFGKTIEHNYTLLKGMHVFNMLDMPLLCGISRKSMIYKLLETTPSESLAGTSALHMVALQNGAQILRVHDVRQANEVIRLFLQF